MNRRSMIKLENCILANSAAAGAFVVALITSWATPILCFVDACQERNGRDMGTGEFMDVLSKKYTERVNKTSNIPFTTYNKYKQKGAERLRKFEERHR